MKRASRTVVETYNTIQEYPFHYTPKYQKKTRKRERERKYLRRAQEDKGLLLRTGVERRRRRRSIETAKTTKHQRGIHSSLALSLSLFSTATQALVFALRCWDYLYMTCGVISYLLLLLLLYSVKFTEYHNFTNILGKKYTKLFTYIYSQILPTHILSVRL